MRKYLKTSEYAKLMGIHFRTAMRYHHEGFVEGYKDENTGRLWFKNPEYKEVNNDQIKAVLYARVSSTTNKPSLDGQIERLTQYATAKGYQIVKAEKEIASGLNDNRKKLNAILKSNDWDVLIVEHKDRLTRFGFNYFSILEKSNQRVEVVNIAENKDAEIVDDLIAIITSFCGEIYGSKRKQKTQAIIDSIKDDNEN